MTQLYEMYDDRLEKENLDYSVNLHRRFASLDFQVEHFGDVCHTFVPGDRVIAEAYFEKIYSYYVTEGVAKKERKQCESTYSAH